MSIAEAYRRLAKTGFAYGGPEEVKAKLADIATYLGTKDPVELGAAFLLEQAGYERSQMQLSLDGSREDRPDEHRSRPPASALAEPIRRGGPHDRR